ncbi:MULTISPECIES: sigma-70 family RNA polymerase sigma factor [Methylomonas]|uniref:RNA polymerase subunit sigma-32 n=1 Tax=Methylomonas koyamae TaxID=702114 RepID=A0A177NAF5_9GAMM|nr:RNA polymerase sigma factor RpoD/SigA [Methylomonas koyamae]OAI14947.1 RNA polymerase subunit sigma-32 [Methylomonas koyamae]
MSELTASNAFEEIQPTQESETSRLAGKLEQARQHLSVLIRNDRSAAQALAEQLIRQLQKGGDCSELVASRSQQDYKALLDTLAIGLNVDCSHCPDQIDQIVDDELVQEDYFVQLFEPQRLNQCDAIRTLLPLLDKLHFMPVFLLAVAASAEALIEDTAYKARLTAARKELKAARQQMISANTGLVAFVAHKYKTSNLSFDDLMQEGLVGLIKAVDRFDPDRGICFSTYAIYWIKQAISRLIVKQERIVRLPVALAEKANTVFDAMRTCYLKNERWPTLEELKAGCDLSEQEIKTISSYYQATHSLDAAVNDDEDGLDLMAKMQQHQFSLPLDELIERDLAQYVDKAVASLPEKQAAILTMRFGLRDHTEMTLQAVADQLHVTRERVRQIQNDALKKLKQQFGFDLMLFLEPRDG